MPLIFSKEEAHYTLAIWKIEEPIGFFEKALGFSSEKKHPKRQLEHLSGRFLLRHLDPTFPFEKIQISPLGKPELLNNEKYFSISHSYPYAAAIIGKDKSVGIDIQVYVEKIERLQQKFLSTTEQSLCENRVDKLTLTWAAKEALFKYYGLGAVDFKNDMPINNILWYQNHAKISMQLNKTREQCVLTGFLSEDFASAWL